MLAQYFGFREEPFGASPDPRWLYRSAQYREALASLRYGFRSNRGFSALIAPPGLGKTTLLYQFLYDIRNSARIVFLFDTQSGPLGLLRYILRDLGIAPATTGDEMHVQLEGVLVKEARAGRPVVVVVDEAQNLSDEALEMLRLLTNYETPQAKLIHIVLSGQPALAQTLTKPSMEQLRQRVTATCWLEPFSIEETTAYIRHRLEQAGYRGAPLFRKDALRRILLASHGVPRIINNLCFNALSLCREMKLKQVDGKMAAEAIAIQELDPEARRKITDRWMATSKAAFQSEPAPQLESPVRSEPAVQSEQTRTTEVAAQPERPPEVLYALKAAHPARAEELRPSEPAVKPEQPPKNEAPDELEQPDQAAGPKTVLRRVRIAAAAAAVLLGTLGIGQFTLPARWQPWSRLTGYGRSSNKEIQPVSRTQTSKVNAGTRNTAALPPNLLPLNAYEEPALIPAPDKAALGSVSAADASAKTKPSSNKLLSLPGSTSPPANLDQSKFAEQNSHAKPSAGRFLPPPVSSLERANVDQVNVEAAPSNPTMSARADVPSITATAMVNTSKATVAESAQKTKAFQVTAAPNETVREISVRYLGVWDIQRLHEIQALNPQLTNLDRLQAGQKIWLPAPQPTPVAQPSSAQGNPSRTPGTGFNASVPATSPGAAIRDPIGSNRGPADPPRKGVGSTAIGSGAKSGLNAKGSNVAPAGIPTVTGTAGVGNYGKVASAGIPKMVSGAIPGKTAVAPVPAEVLSRPSLPSDPTEQSTLNCGGIAEIPCPKLRVRTPEHQD